MTETHIGIRLADINRVVVGSRNPVKIAAVAAIFARISPQVLVEGRSADSDVPDQPWGDDQTIRGARNRALRVLHDDPSAQLGVGLEGGVVELPDGHLRTCAWAVVRDRDGREGVGGSLAMPLPPRVVARLRNGEELGHAMDAEAQVENTKQGLGAVGILTGGLLDRQQAYEPLVAYALAPFLATAFFREPPGHDGDG